MTPPNDVNVIRNHLLGLAPNETNWDSVSHTESIRVPEPFVIPDVGHMPMVVHPELVNPVISDFLIKNCGLHTLSGAWQALHRTKGENKWDLKNFAKASLIRNNGNNVILFADKGWIHNSGHEQRQ